MSRITKELANRIAEKLISKQLEEVKKLNFEFEEKVYLAILKTIPKEVMDCYEKNPDFFNTTRSFYMYGKGWHSETIASSKKLPKNNFFSAEKLNEADSNKLLKERQLIDDKKLEAKKLLKEIEVALYSLRTYTRISEHLPEAIPFLPSATSTALQVNLSDIRKKIS